MFILPSLFGITEASSLPAALILFFAVSAFFFPRFFRKKNADRNNRRFSHLLVLLLLIMTAAFRISSVQADNIILGSGAIIENNKVYFGTYNNSPVLWRVLKTGDGKALLLSEYLLDRTQFNPNYTMANANVWLGSNAETWCSSFYNNWPAGIEKYAILPTSVQEANDKTIEGYPYYYKGGYGGNYYYGAAPLSNAYFFFLSAKEADKLFNDDNDRKASGAGTSFWWLRSPDAYNSKHAGEVIPDGGVLHSLVNDEDWARPAFNLNLSSVLFSSEISSESSKSYKLTLVDTGQTVSVTSGKTLTRNSLTSVTVPYTIDTGSNHVSLLITNNNDTWTAGTGWSSGAAAQYYETAAVTDSTGTVTFTLPDNYEDNRGRQKVWLLAEDVNDGNQSNYAGAPVEVTIPYLLQFAPGEGGSGTMDSKSVSEGDSFIFPACTFTPPAGKKFDHWKMSGVDGLFYERSVITIAPNCVKNGVITVTAYWKDTPPATITKAPEAKNPTYIDTAQELITAGTAEGGKMQYAIGENSTTAPTSGWSADIPQETSAGTYYIWYKAAGDDTHSDSEPQCCTAKIEQAENPAKITSTAEVVQGGNTVDLSANVTDAVGNVSYAITGDAKGCSVDAGSGILTSGNTTGAVTVTVTVADSRNYTGKNAEITVTIAEKLIDYDRKPLTEVPEGLKAIGITSVSEIEQRLLLKLEVSGEPAKIEQTVFYDVELKVSSDGGKTWKTATVDNFPESGLEVRLDYPEGTGKATHQFSVSHMFTVGEKAGQMEYPAVNPKDDGLYVKLTGLSPVAIAWREIETPEPERPGIDFFLLHGDCELPATGFSALRPTALPEQPKDLRYEPVRMHLMLPTLDREVELVTMPREGNSWVAAWLGSDAGILEGSALPGEGVSVIAGHNTLNNTEYGPFALLATLEVNDLIASADDEGSLKLFRVYANDLLEPGEMAALAAIAGQEENPLVLVTCENESPDGGYLNRRVIFAKQVL